MATSKKAVSKDGIQFQNKYIWWGGGGIVILLVVYLIGKYANKAKMVEEKQIDVKVDIQDINGQTVKYDPNPLLMRLHEGLTVGVWWDVSERCASLKELYNLDAARFMAAVKAYKAKYNEDIRSHMAACWYDGCGVGPDGQSYFALIEQRITALGDVIH